MCLWNVNSLLLLLPSKVPEPGGCRGHGHPHPSLGAAHSLETRPMVPGIAAMQTGKCDYRAETTEDPQGRTHSAFYDPVPLTSLCLGLSCRPRVLLSHAIPHSLRSGSSRQLLLIPDALPPPQAEPLYLPALRFPRKAPGLPPRS